MGGSAWDDTSVRQRIAQFAMEVEAIKYTGFRQLTRQLKGLPPGPEGSMMKLCATELGLKIAMFAMELLGPYSQIRARRGIRDRPGHLVASDAGGARPDDLRRDQSDSAQHHRRAGTGPAQRIATACPGDSYLPASS